MGPATLMCMFRDAFIRTGAAELIGGEAALDSGIADLKTGALVVAAELVKAEKLGVDLADAVLDSEGFPHTCEVHGVFADVLVANVPAEVLPWATRVLSMAPFPESAEVNRTIAAIAATSSNIFHRVLARFALFEGFCVQQKLLLRASGVQLEVLNGRRRDVEGIAEREVRIACELALACGGLLTVEDPGRVLMAIVTRSLDQHVETLREELARLSAEVHEQLQRRKQLMAVLERVEPADAIIILNAAEDVSGEERMTPAQLRVLHPVLLGDLSDDAIHQRLARMPDRVRRTRRAKAKATSFSDLILEAGGQAQR